MASTVKQMEKNTSSNVHFIVLQMTDSAAVNDSAIGLVTRHEEEDMKHIKELVLLRMSQSFPPKSSSEENKSKEEQNDESAVQQLKEEVLQLKMQLERQSKETKTLKEELEEKKKSLW